MARVITSEKVFLCNCLVICDSLPWWANCWEWAGDGRGRSCELRISNRGLENGARSASVLAGKTWPEGRLRRRSASTGVLPESASFLGWEDGRAGLAELVGDVTGSLIGGGDDVGQGRMAEKMDGARELFDLGDVAGGRLLSHDFPGQGVVFVLQLGDPSLSAGFEQDVVGRSGVTNCE